VPVIRRIDLQIIDKIFGMGDGYVLDFSDATMSQFFAEHLNIDIDDKQYREDGTSKAKRLRCCLRKVDVPTAVRVLNALWEYREVRRALTGQEESFPSAHAQFLNLLNRIEGKPNRPSTAPRNWQGTNKFRLFISHIAKDKDKATRLKDCLAPYAISGFVAHEDIHPTLEWQKEIEHALYTMDAFLAIHTPGFKDSFWTQQEIGFAVGRGAKIISFKMGEDPTGFISKHQALARRNRTAEQIALEVDAILAADPLTAGKLDAAKRSNG
jgi:hypothetical protein